MLRSSFQRPTTTTAVVGLLLIAAGAVALVLRTIGVNLFEAIGPWGWPFFVIVPGVVLLALSLVPVPPKGVGFAIGGAVVTTVGSLLLYQSQTGHWESWSYAWALIPTMVGVAMTMYGLLAGARGLVTSGSWMAGISFGLFLVGGWFFEGLFAGEQRPLDVANWWPIGLMILGALFVIRAVITRPETMPPTNERTRLDGTPLERDRI
jgi:hypothetical protein